MNKFFKYVTLLTITGNLYSQEINTGVITSDYEQKQLYFHANLIASDIHKTLVINNGKEKIELKSKLENDSLKFQFIDYNAVIKINKLDYKGYWINNDETNSKKRQIEFIHKNPIIENDLLISKQKSSIEGEWKIELNSQGKTNLGLAIFKNDSLLTGTIRTETGDYRFLNQMDLYQDKFMFSAFNGNNIYNFTLNYNLDNNRFIGNLITAKTKNYTALNMYKDPNFVLKNPNTITEIVNDKPFNFEGLQDEKGKNINYKKLSKNKLHIVTIFGTWCPNCIDETNFLKELKAKYPKLEVFIIAYEIGPNIEAKQQKIKRFIENKKVNFNFMIAEDPSKNNVMNRFPMINDFRSYPTLFLVNKQGKIIYTHTGFNGPATEHIYDEFKNEMFKLVKETYKDKKRRL